MGVVMYQLDGDYHIGMVYVNYWLVVWNIFYFP